MRREPLGWVSQALFLASLQTSETLLPVWNPSFFPKSGWGAAQGPTAPETRPSGFFHFPVLCCVEVLRGHQTGSWDSNACAGPGLAVCQEPPEKRSFGLCFHSPSRPVISRLEPAEATGLRRGAPLSSVGGFPSLEASAPKPVPGPPGLVERSQAACAQGPRAPDKPSGS